MQNIKKLSTLKPGIILLGFITLATQILLLREFLTLFNGNELVIGVILANWMLLTGFGAYFGKLIGDTKYRQIWILILLGALAFMPTITVLALHEIWHSTFAPGMMAGLAHVFYYSLFILGPFCIISGILFTLFAKHESFFARDNKIGNVYALESVGSLIGGVVVNFILIWITTTFQSLFIIMVAVVIFTFFLAIKNDRYVLSTILLILSFVFGYFFMHNDLDNKIRKLAFPSQELVYISDSPFGLFAITKHGEQLNYYENNILMASTGDVIEKEESVHFAMVQHSNPKNILVLSGLISGIAQELEKYPVNKIDYVDINPEIFKIAEKTINSDIYKKLNLINEDPVRYLRQNHKKYDVVLINLPKPSTIQLNRYYTKEFFDLLKGNLNTNAIVLVSLPSSANYLNDEARKLLSIIYKTLQTEFNNLLILPASNDFLLASDVPVYSNIAERIDILGIPTEYVNMFYFDDQLIKQRSNQLHEQIDQEALINKDFSPVFYQSQLQLWMSQFNMKYWFPAFVILLFSGIFFFKAGIIYRGVFAAGFAGTSIEIILLLVFQVVFGYVYAVVGIFVMVFMAGLAVGAYYPRYIKEITRKKYYGLQILLSLFAFLIPFVFVLIKNLEINDIILFSIFAILVLVVSFLTGAIFSVASKIAKEDYGYIAFSAYGLDLLGAATGALLFTIYLIPLLGFIWSVLIIGAFNLLLALVGKSH